MSCSFSWLTASTLQIRFAAVSAWQREEKQKREKCEKNIDQSLQLSFLIHTCGLSLLLSALATYLCFKTCVLTSLLSIWSSIIIYFSLSGAILQRFSAPLIPPYVLWANDISMPFPKLLWWDSPVICFLPEGSSLSLYRDRRFLPPPPLPWPAFSAAAEWLQ